MENKEMPSFGKFQKIIYPDGQISAKWVRGKYDTNSLAVRPVTVRERINSYTDLFYIRAIADVIHESQAPTLTTGKLFIPCMFGQRSDRRFDAFQSFDLKLITDIINECNFKEVEIFDPHSDVTMALVNNSVKKSSFEYVERAINDIRLDYPKEDLLLVSPDAGAYKKVFEFGEKLNLPVMGAMKHRDKDGKITLMFTHDVEDKYCLIVDDLCDGGYTFELLGKSLKEHKAAKVYLYVSHGIFSKGFEAMKIAGIEHIYCTNSVKDIISEVFFHEKGSSSNLLTTDYVTQYKRI